VLLFFKVMASIEAFPGGIKRSPEQVQSDAELLCARIMERLGNSYFKQKLVKTTQLSFDPRLFIHSEILIMQRGLLRLRRKEFGAKTFMTLLADGHFVRHIEINEEVQKALNSPLQEIEGFVMGDGVRPLSELPNRIDIPPSVRNELGQAGVKYYARKHIYLYRNDPWNSVEALRREYK
jgi:hypothetical protein